MFYENKNFSKKYNNEKEIPYESLEFLEWFEINKNRINKLNVTNEDKLDIDNYLSNFELDSKGINNGIK